MSKIQIICTSPGMRRNGITHPPSAFYDTSEWTPEQMQAFASDPAFTVRPVDETIENVQTPVDFQLAVDAEVKRQLTAHALILQGSFEKTVAELVAEKTQQFSADAVDLGNKLEVGNTRIAELEAELVKALAAAPAANAVAVTVDAGSVGPVASKAIKK